MNGIYDLMFAVDQYANAMRWDDAEEVEYTEITTDEEEDKRMVGRL